MAGSPTFNVAPAGRDERFKSPISDKHAAMKLACGKANRPLRAEGFYLMDAASKKCMASLWMQSAQFP